jgi:hypothetical protein
MKSENPDPEDITDTPRKAVEQSIRVISIGELRSLADRLFKDPRHPWSEPFRHFIDENSGNTFYHASTKEQIEIIYCPAMNKGIWFIQEVGVGIMQAWALHAMKKIVQAK